MSEARLLAAAFLLLGVFGNALAANAPVAVSPGDRSACSPVILSDDTLLEKQELTSCKFILGPNYGVMGPNGDLTLSSDDVEVLDSFSVGIDAKLTVQGLGPPPLELTLDSENAVSLLVSPESGGVLATTAADGTEYSLDIPPDALWGESVLGESVEVTMTPIAAVSNLPFSGGFHWGVDLAPDDLVLLEAATLTISPSSAPAPEALSGGYRANGEGFHLYPMLAESGDLLFAVSHFSGAIVGSGNDADVHALRNQWASRKERYLQELAANLRMARMAGWNLSELTEEQKALFLGTFTSWYSDVVRPELDQALDCGRAGCSEYWQLSRQAVIDGLTWAKQFHVLGLEEEPSLQALFSEWRTIAQAGFEEVYTIQSALCEEQSGDYCDKKKQRTELLRLLRMLSIVFATDYDSWIDDVCGGLLDRALFDVTVAVSSSGSVSIGGGVDTVETSGSKSMNTRVMLGSWDCEVYELWDSEDVQTYSASGTFSYTSTGHVVIPCLEEGPDGYRDTLYEENCQFSSSTPHIDWYGLWWWPVGSDEFPDGWFFIDSDFLGFLPCAWSETTTGVEQCTGDPINESDSGTADWWDPISCGPDPEGLPDDATGNSFTFTYLYDDILCIGAPGWSGTYTESWTASAVKVAE